MIQGTVEYDALIIGISQIVHFTVYLWAVYMLLRRHTTIVHSNFSSLEKISLQWRKN